MYRVCSSTMDNMKTADSALGLCLCSGLAVRCVVICLVENIKYGVLVNKENPSRRLINLMHWMSYYFSAFLVP